MSLNKAVEKLCMKESPDRHESPGDDSLLGT